MLPQGGGDLAKGQPVLARRDVAPKVDDRTVGVEITTWKPDPAKSLEFSVWDFAGQKQYHATHELYFSPRALYVLCWDMGVTRNELFLPEREVQDERFLSEREVQDDGCESEVRRTLQTLPQLPHVCSLHFLRSSQSSELDEPYTFEPSDDEDEDNEADFKMKKEKVRAYESGFAGRPMLT